MFKKAMCMMCGNLQPRDIYENCTGCGASSIHFEYGRLKNSLSLIKAEGLIKALRSNFYDKYFDWRYSVDTSRKITKKKLNVNNSDRFNSFGVYYSAAHFTTLKKAFDSLPLDPQKSTLLDFGSGKGRVMMYALLNGFKKVIGVEYSKKLCEITEKNMRSLEVKKRRKYEYEILNIDASYYKIDKDVDVVFMFNPFSGDVFEKVVSNIQKSAKQKELYYIYININYKLPKEFVVYKKISEKSIIFRVH